MPGTTDASQLGTVQGSGYLPIKVYSNSNVAGLDGAGSTITSLALGIDIAIFDDQNGNGVKDSNESWAANTAVDVFNLSDDPLTAPPLYNGVTNTKWLFIFCRWF